MPQMFNETRPAQTEAQSPRAPKTTHSAPERRAAVRCVHSGIEHAEHGLGHWMGVLC